MKGTRHSEEQIMAILKQGEAGLTTAELCRQHGITEQTYYRWKAKYGGMESGDAKKMKQLEDENRKLKYGRSSRRRVPVATVEKVFALYREEYFDLNVQHFRGSCRPSTGST